MLDSKPFPTAQEVKDYLNRRFSRENAHLHQIRTQSLAEGLPEIHVPIYVGKLLYLLAQIQQAHQILEIGTLSGYSTAWLAQALPPTGRLVSLEVNPNYAAMARKNLESLSGKTIEIREGYAIESLSQLVAANEGPFDLIFVDADKENYALYLDWSLRLSRIGTLIVFDNLIPKGDKIGYPSNEEAKSMYAFNDYLAQHSAVETAAFPTLGNQGRFDALALVRVCTKV